MVIILHNDKLLQGINEMTVYGKQELVSRYSKALYDSAKEKNEVARVLKDADDLLAMINSCSELANMMKNPAISVKERMDAMGVLSQKTGFSETFSDFIKVVTSNRRLFCLSEMLTSFQEVVDRENGIETVTVRTAHSLDEKERDFIKQTMGNILNKKIKINSRVDKTLLGGIQISVGSVMIDSSYKTKLNQVRLLMVKD